MSSKISETNLTKKVLIAEDDDSMRRFLQVILIKQTYETFTAKDGLEALEIALNKDIDVVITDAVMPNLTGYDLCRILRQNPDKNHVKLIILSGYNQENLDNSDRCLADFYLLKDSNLKKNVIATLSKILENQFQI